MGKVAFIAIIAVGVVIALGWALAQILRNTR